MKSRLRAAAVALLWVAGVLPAAALGDTAAFQFSIGTQGVLSFAEVGVSLPPIGGGVVLGLKARVMSSLTWATFTHRDGRSVSVHPAVAGAVLSCGGSSPLFADTYRMYGGMDLLLGCSFTPYDSLIYDTGNLIGPNLTFALWGYYGLELFTADNVSYCLDSGGGYKGLRSDKENLYALASSWLGSGFGIKTGMRFYF